MLKRILKISFLLISVLVIGGSLYFLSMDFRWSDQKFISQLKKNDLVGEVIYTSTTAGDIRSVTSGPISGPWIVFVHGAPGSNKDFSRYLLDEELTASARLILVDRPGYGYSSYGVCMPSVKEQAAIIAGTLPNGSIIVGHSYGGPIAAAIAMYYPEKAKELILLAPAVDPKSEKHFAINKIINHQALKWTLSGALKVALEEKLTHEEALAEIMDDWSSITQSVTIVHGEKDNIVPFENSAFLQRVLVNADLEFHSPDDMDHIMIWTKYEWVKELLLSKTD